MYCSTQFKEVHYKSNDLDCLRIRFEKEKKQ